MASSLSLWNIHCKGRPGVILGRPKDLDLSLRCMYFFLWQGRPGVIPGSPVIGLCVATPSVVCCLCPLHNTDFSLQGRPGVIRVSSDSLCPLLRVHDLSHGKGRSGPISGGPYTG